MPLNNFQKIILKKNLQDYVEKLIEQNQTEWLAQVIKPVNLDQAVVVSILKRNLDTLADIQKAINVPSEVATQIKQLMDSLQQPNPTIPQTVLEMLKRYPNYNPFNIAAVKQFEEETKSLKEKTRQLLIYLRKLYLEVTLAIGYPYRRDLFKFRVSMIPLNLDKFGDNLSSGEISKEVADYIKHRLRLLKGKQILKEASQNNSVLRSFPTASANNSTTLFQPDRVGNSQQLNSALASPTVLPPIEIIFQFSKISNEQAEQSDSAYLNPTVLLPEVVKSLEWYRWAANQECRVAQYWLGICYYYGQGVEQDFRKAVEWYQKAAYQGYAHAQGRLGECYEYGRGVSRDYKEALRWYREARLNGFVVPVNHLKKRKKQQNSYRNSGELPQKRRRPGCMSN